MRSLSCLARWEFRTSIVRGPMLMRRSPPVLVVEMRTLEVLVSAER